MENNKKIKISALAVSTILAGSLSANTNEFKALEDLGTGAELRSELLANLNPIQFFKNTEVELTCGEGKCGEKSKEDKKADSKEAATKEGEKAGEHKCGEGKCGEKATDDKKAATKEVKAEKEAKPAKEAKPEKAAAPKK